MRTYTYAVPDELADVEAGEAVIVEFGRRQALAIVLGDAAEPQGIEAKPLAARVRADGPLLPPLSLSLARWIAGHYLVAPALVLRAMLPPRMLERLELVVERTPASAAGGGTGGMDVVDARSARPARRRAAARPGPRRAGGPCGPAPPAPRARGGRARDGRLDADGGRGGAALRTLDPADRRGARCGSGPCGRRRTPARPAPAGRPGRAGHRPRRAACPARSCPGATAAGRSPAWSGEVLP